MLLMSLFSCIFHLVDIKNTAVNVVELFCNLHTDIKDILFVKNRFAFIGDTQKHSPIIYKFFSENSQL